MNSSEEFEKRAFVGILFECCKVYARVYRSKDELRYSGRCPKCFRGVELRVDPEKGSNSRFWRAK